MVELVSSAVGLIYPLLLALAVLYLAASVLGPAYAMGDEHDYLQSGASGDPCAPQMFLRVPLLGLLSAGARRTRSPESTLRGLSLAVSVTTTVVTTLAAWFALGPTAALVAGVLMAASPSRAVYARRLWPDVYLALWLALILLTVVAPGIDIYVRSAAIGLLCGLAFLTRFDALLCAPLCLPLFEAADAATATLVLLPTAALFILLSIRNWLRYRIALPDNTWVFNLRIAAHEAAHRVPGRVRVEPLITAIAESEVRGGVVRQSLRASFALLLRPVRFLVASVKKLWFVCGADSFAMQRMLPPLGRGYADIPPLHLLLLKLALVAEFPLLIAALIFVSLQAPPSPLWAWPALALVVGNVFHARTRFRQAWYPALVLALVDGARRMPEIRWTDDTAILSAGVAALVCLALVFLPSRSEA